MHPVQKELLEKYDSSELAIIEVNSDQQQHLDRVAEKMRTDGLTWDIITDGSDGPLTKKWRVSAHPTYFVIDQNQIIRRRATGYLGDRLTEWVEELIDGEPSQ